MKKIILGFAALAFIFTITPAMAAGPKPPTALCLDFVLFSDFHQLVIKSMGTVKTSGGVTKMFNITGHAFGLSPNYSVHGSGYITPGTTVFHASYNGNGRSGTTNNILSWELFFDVAAQTGSIFAFFLFDNGTSFTSTALAVVPTDCAALPIAGSPARECAKVVGE
jgi:hypothetical protein